MANLIPTEQVFSAQFLEQNTRGLVDPSEMGEFILIYNVELFFSFPIDPEYDPEAARKVIGRAVETLQPFSRRLRPRSSRSISWAFIREPQILPFISGFNSAVRITAQIRGISRSDMEQMNRNIMNLGIHHQQLQRQGIEVLELMEREFGELLNNNLAQRFQLIDTSSIPSIERKVPEQLTLTPEEELEVLKRRKQRLSISSQEREFIIERRKQQEQFKKPVSESEIIEEPPEDVEDLSPRKRQGFFSRMRTFFQRLFRSK